MTWSISFVGRVSDELPIRWIDAVVWRATASTLRRNRALLPGARVILRDHVSHVALRVQIELMIRFAPQGEAIVNTDGKQTAHDAAPTI